MPSPGASAGLGFVDDVHGADMITGVGSGGPSSGHGTAVAGLLGAVPNNGRGGTGVCWKTQLVSVRVLRVLGGYVSDVIKGRSTPRASARAC